ncbi:MAG: DUF6573 family protein [Methylococcaceae bacterium]
MTQLHFNSAVASPLHITVSQFPQALSAKPFFSYRDFKYRKEAIKEGYLVDVSKLSRTFKADVAITRELWELYVAVDNPNGFKERFRAVSLLAQAKMAIKHADPHASEVFFEVKQFPRKLKSYLNKVRLWLVISSGDSHEPVLTIMLDTQHGEAL